MHCTPRRVLACRCSLKAANRLVCFFHACVACVRCLSRAPSHTLLPHTTTQIMRTSDTRSLRPCTLSTNLYIVNPEPETLKPKHCARIGQWYDCVMYIDGDTIVVSMRAHQYRLALRRQVLRIGGTKNRAQQYKLALRQRVIRLKTTDVTIMYMKQTKTP